MLDRLHKVAPHLKTGLLQVTSGPVHAGHNRLSLNVLCPLHSLQIGFSGRGAFHMNRQPHAMRLIFGRTIFGSSPRFIGDDRELGHRRNQLRTLGRYLGQHPGLEAAPFMPISAKSYRFPGPKSPFC